MGDETNVQPGLDGNLGNGNVNVPDSTGPGQMPDTIPEPQPMPEPQQKDEPLPPEPLIGPAGF